MVNQLEHGNSKHPARGQVCLTQIQAMVKQLNLLNFFQPIRTYNNNKHSHTCTHPCMPIKGVICNVVQCNARVFMAMVVVVVARHEQSKKPSVHVR